jgi:hypothetical protein
MGPVGVPGECGRTRKLLPLGSTSGGSDERYVAWMIVRDRHSLDHSCLLGG